MDCCMVTFFKVPLIRKIDIVCKTHVHFIMDFSWETRTGAPPVSTAPAPVGTAAVGLVSSYAWSLACYLKCSVFVFFLFFL